MAATIIDSGIFSDIFSTAKMRAIFSDETRVQFYLDIEAALARVQARLGIIPQEAADEIGRYCRLEAIDMAKLKTQTERIGYPVLGVVQQLVAASRNGLGEWCHWGATTQDITDTATVMQVRAALALVEEELETIRGSLADLARGYRDTPMAARSNLQHAVPITFGYKAAVLLSGVRRHLERLKELRPRVLIGEFGGAAGNLSSLGRDGLKVQAALMAELELGQPEIAWHTMRDNIAEVACF
ncbi:MAG: 3-carboxy-cis,cis-muconate cycloisomerase, partial [Hyphomicrobiales bacterium]|nr:3-carboxy-cis,cis-muconate cycloisomerase [Hyphomicrobiales bacterium]